MFGLACRIVLDLTNYGWVSVILPWEVGKERGRRATARDDSFLLKLSAIRVRPRLFFLNTMKPNTTLNF
jgi:hypothetical protein